MVTLNYIPSEQEIKNVHEIRDFLIRTVKKQLAEKHIEAEVMAVGSTAKDTFVKGSMDIDIFIVSPKYKEAYKMFQQVFTSGKRKEGPMDIWHFIYRNYDVDLVFIPPDHPRIETLEHTAFMNRNLTPELKREVVKAKAFFKSKGVYGAEIGGIVGIAIEELVRQHRTLENVCKTLLSYKEKPYIPDPINPQRNLLASIVKIRWKQIQNACNEYLSKKHFTFQSFTPTEYMKNKRTWTHLNFQRKHDRATDFNTALSVCNHALNQIRNREPEVKGTCDAYVWNHVTISYHVTPEKLPKTKIYCGPPIDRKNAVEAFKFVHPDSFEKDGKICTIVEREKTDVVQWMKDLITNRMHERNYLSI